MVHTRTMNQPLTQLDRNILVTMWSLPRWGRKTYRRIQEKLTHDKTELAKWWFEQAQIDDLLLRPAQRNSLAAWRNRFTLNTYAELLAQRNIMCVLETDAEYPKLLLETPDHPPILFVKGNRELLTTTMINVVGTRNMTNYGQTVTSKITQELVAAGMTICSGFMYGVDACAHRTAITTGGKTVAVLGYGFDHLYPAHFHEFMIDVLKTNNTFVTEYAPFVTPSPATFPLRNRLMAGMSLGVVVTEAARKSGSHITAEAAIEYGRSVYAIPGPITNPYTEGTKDLINVGAMCVSSGQEILADLKVEAEQKEVETVSHHLTQDLQSLYQLLTHQSHSLTELADLTHQSTTKLLADLAQLELQKVVVRSHGQWLISSS